eukprot:1232661-Rhodomonas_salina.2
MERAMKLLSSDLNARTSMGCRQPLACCGPGTEEADCAGAAHQDEWYRRYKNVLCHSVATPRGGEDGSLDEAVCGTAGIEGVNICGSSR